MKLNEYYSSYLKLLDAWASVNDIFYLFLALDFWIQQESLPAASSLWSMYCLLQARQNYLNHLQISYLDYYILIFVLKMWIQHLHKVKWFMHVGCFVGQIVTYLDGIDLCIRGCYIKLDYSISLSFLLNIYIFFYFSGLSFVILPAFHTSWS